MKALSVGAALAAALVTGGLLAGQAFAASPAQPPSPNSGCGAALLALSQAENAAADALAADGAAADAKKADDALADAVAAVAAARAAALTGGATTDDLADSGAALRAAKKAILDQPGDPTQAQQDEIVKIDAKLVLIDAHTAAQAKAAAAKVVADKTDADALRREADKTDTASLNDAAVKASAAADKACGNSGNVRFENCDQVRTAGLAPLRFDQPGYRVGLDADRDGQACEAVENTRRSATPRIPTAIDTGYFGS